MSAQHRFEWVQRSTTKRIGDLGFRAAEEIDRRKLGTGDLGFSSHPPPGQVRPDGSRFAVGLEDVSGGRGIVPFP